jgi:dolichol-phosphate mannosyltransferase
MTPCHPERSERSERSRRTVSVVVPCYNEADGIAQLKTKLTPVLDRLGVRYAVDLTLVDDGSTDQTYVLLCEAFSGDARARVIRHERNQNLGGAIRTGIRETKGEWIANLDSDCTYDPALLETMLAEMERGADLVTVSPYHPRGRVEGVPPQRLFLSKSLSAVYRALLHRPIYTFTAMNRVYRRAVCERIASPASDFTSVAEMMIKAARQGLKIAEVPAVLSVRRFGESKMKTGSVIRAHLGLVRRLVTAPSSFAA